MLFRVFLRPEKDSLDEHGVYLNSSEKAKYLINVDIWEGKGGWGGGGGGQQDPSQLNIVRNHNRGRRP